MRFEVSGHHIWGKWTSTHPEDTPQSVQSHLNGFWKNRYLKLTILGDFEHFLAKKGCKMLVLCIVQSFQSNLFWKQVTWHKRTKDWREDIMSKIRASFVNESRIWLSIVAFQLTILIKGSSKKLFFTSFWYYNNVDHW